MPTTDKSVGLFIHLLYNGDMKADSNGARLPTWVHRLSAFIFPVDSVPAASKITEGKQGLKGTDPNTDGLIIHYFTSYKYVSKTNLPVDADWM